MLAATTFEEPSINDPNPLPMLSECPISVTRKQTPNVNKSCPKMISLEKG